MKKFTAIFFLALFLLSNLGLTVNTHYCGGHAQEHAFSLGLSKLSCGMEEFASCDNPDKDFIKAVSCCEDQHQTLQVDEDLRQQSQTVFNLFPLISAHFTSFHQEFSVQERTVNHPVVNSPPVRTGQHILIAQQRFLI